MDIFYLIETFLIGLAGGVSSGMFGIGGSVVRIPLMRMLLGLSGHLAIGTSLPLIIPASLSGIIVYGKSRTIDYKLGTVCGLAGTITAVLGAMLMTRFSSSFLMLTLSIIPLALAFCLLLTKTKEGGNAGVTDRQLAYAGVLGVAVGFLSGFYGIGGGAVLVPLLMVMGVPVKRAISSSLLAVLIFAIPGSIEHYLLGHVDLGLMMLLLVGSVAGGAVGAKIVVRQEDMRLKNAYIGFLVLLGLSLAIFEISML